MKNKVINFKTLFFIFDFKNGVFLFPSPYFIFYSLKIWCTFLKLLIFFIIKIKQGDGNKNTLFFIKNKMIEIKNLIL
jgi:hypothetical protein